MIKIFKFRQTEGTDSWSYTYPNDWHWSPEVFHADGTWTESGKQDLNRQFTVINIWNSNKMKRGTKKTHQYAVKLAISNEDIVTSKTMLKKLNHK